MSYTLIPPNCRTSGMDYSGFEPAEITTNYVDHTPGWRSAEVINYENPVVETDGWSPATIYDWQPPRPPAEPGTAAPAPPAGGVAGYWVVDHQGRHARIDNGKTTWIAANNFADPRDYPR